MFMWSSQKGKSSEHVVYKLHKALYGLKQAPRAWFIRIEAHFSSEGFKNATVSRHYSQREAEKEKLSL